MNFFKILLAFTLIVPLEHFDSVNSDEIDKQR